MFWQKQEKGYAESDPTADVGGLDAARNLLFLPPAFNTVWIYDVLVEGIDGLDLCDIEHGKELGNQTRLLLKTMLNTALVFACVLRCCS